MKKENLEFPEALQTLAQRAGVQLVPRTPERQAAEERGDRLLEISADAADWLEGPRIVACGLHLTASGSADDFVLPHIHLDPSTYETVDGIDDILKAVRPRVKRNVDWVKFYATGGHSNMHDQEYTGAEMVALVGDAHAKHRPLAAHAILSQGMRAAVLSGVDSIEHGVGLTNEIAVLMVQRGTVLVPALYTSHAVFERWAKGTPARASVHEAEVEREVHFSNFRQAVQSGVKIAMGTDCGWGPCEHGANAKELELMARNGTSPMDAIRASTQAAAQALHLGEHLGTLEPGKWADLLVVADDPLTDLTVLQQAERIALVMKGGVIHATRCGL